MKIEDFGMDTITLNGSLEGKLQAIRAAGFTHVMLSARDMTGHPGGEAAAVAAVRHSGLRVTGLQVLRDFEGLSGRLRDYKIDVAKAMLQLCRLVGSKLLLVCSSTSAHANGDRDAIIADLRVLAMLAVPYGIRICYEGLSWGRHVNRLDVAWDIVERADRANLGLAIDSFHALAHRAPGDDSPWDVLDDMDPQKIFFVQLSDFMWSEVRTLEERIETARHMRVFPGEGVHNEAVAEVARRLDAMGYDGDYSFEVFNDDYQQMPVDQVARRARDSVNWIVARIPRLSLPVRRSLTQAGADVRI